jgi:hypothetical protein
VWKRLQKPELTLTNLLSERLWEMEQRRSGNFPSFDVAQPLLVFSDYGGSHGGSRCDSYSFFLTQPPVLNRWEEDRRSIRRAYGFEQGRMAYKDLGKEDRARVLWPWLVAADDLDGLLVTIVVDRSLRSFFNSSEVVRLQREIPGYAAMSRKTIERVFRICHFLSVFVAGLVEPEQEVVWISDQDDIAANDSIVQLFKRTFLNVSAMYLKAPLKTFHFATTAKDNGSLQIEDLASLPDLMAGATSVRETQCERCVTCD